MANSCRLAPVVFRRNGTKIEEVDSKLFADIKEAVKDDSTAWEMWAYSKTADFKQRYKDVEYDELGEVTFPSLIKALGLEESYNSQKDMEQAAKQHGLDGKTFKTAVEAVEKLNKFNRAESRFVAAMQKEGDAYKVYVMPRRPETVTKARQQSYNYALTGEIIDLLSSMGLGVEWVSDPKFEGLFDPENATLHEGLLRVIKIAKGLMGEQALPEEFAHLIIEGLSGHPHVQRLLEALDDEQIKEILGNMYDDYSIQYLGDAVKMKKEAAGKLLAEYIIKKGTIRPSVVQRNRGLLSKIWNWAKGIFSKITDRQMDEAGMRAHDRVAEIYNLVASGDAIGMVSKQAIMDGDTLYKLREKFNDVEKLAREGLTRAARLVIMEGNENGKISRNTKNHFEDIEKNVESNPVISIVEFLKMSKDRLLEAHRKAEVVRKNMDYNYTDIRRIRQVARVVTDINALIDGFEEYLLFIEALTDEDRCSEVGISLEEGEALAEYAGICIKALNKLKNFQSDTTLNALYNAARKEYKEDKVRGIGSRRNEILAMHTILEHAEKDLNVIDRYLASMGDASDELLVIIDGLVKNQKYERDMEMIEIEARIAKADEKLRKAGYSSDFMYERDSEGVPVGRIISQYDWDAYNADRKRMLERLNQQELSDKERAKAIAKWKAAKIDGEPRLLKIYVDPEIDRQYRENGDKAVPDDAIYDIVPNPKVYKGKASVIENLAPAQREYYREMMTIKREAMTKIPRKGQAIFKTVNISKDLVEGVLDNSTGSPIKAVLENFKKKFIRRPDEIGFGTHESFPEDIRQILESEKDSDKAAEKIIDLLAEQTDDDIVGIIYPEKLKRIIDRIRRHRADYASEEEMLQQMRDEIMASIAMENFYMVETDFAGRRIQKLPIYYTRPLKNMKMLSTDFSGTLTAYSAMTTNYQKMNEVVDIVEMTKDYLKGKERGILEREGGRGTLYAFKVFGKTFRGLINKAGRSNIIERLEDYADTNIYEIRKENEGTVEVLGVPFDQAKILDTIKDYTGILALGFNLFSTFSNLGAGKMQQWIEAVGGEYFNVKDYAKACKQYTVNMPGCIAEMGSKVKKNKLSLLIQMFDPMGDYFESLRSGNHYNSYLSRVLGNNALGYIGMNAGEHILHCQTMLAILNHIKVTEEGTGKQISLYDALEVKEGEDGIYRLVMKDNLYYERDVIDNSGTVRYDKEKRMTVSTNPNYGRPKVDENGKKIKEKIELKGNNLETYLIKKRRVIRKVNDSLNGAFSADEKGAAHKFAIMRLVLQFRQWMPAHYMRRFARAHYDADLEQWREGYYTTVYKTMESMWKDLRKGKLEILKTFKSLDNHEQSNLLRAGAEISMFFTLLVLCKLGGRVKDRDRSWLDRMALYQIHRMYLETGASMPSPQFLPNLIQLLMSPAAAINTLDKFEKVLHFDNMWDEIQSGRYQGWTEWERDLYHLTPYLPQITKAIDLDDSMFSMFENKR